MNIGMVLVSRRDSWRKTLRGTSTTVGLKVLRTVVTMLYPVHSRDILVSFLHYSLSPLFVCIGTITFVVQSVGIFSSFYIP
jgi:hypothetical protein